MTVSIFSFTVQICFTLWEKRTGLKYFRGMTECFKEIRYWRKLRNDELYSFSLLSLFWKIIVGLWDDHVVCVSRRINFWMLEPIFMKLGMYIMAHEPISTAYFLNPSYQSVCLYVYPPIVARQRFCKNVTAATNAHATIEELFDESFSMRSVSYQSKVGY
jgi:hypothetical protein